MSIENTTENQVIREMAYEAAAREPIPVSDTQAVLVLRGDQHIEEFDLEQYLPAPTRKRGHVHLTEAESLAEYVNRHSSFWSTTLWADVNRGVVVAVLDDHDRANRDVDTGPTPEGAPQPGWGEHRATLTLQETEDWAHWLSRDGKLIDQVTFAEHIEDGVDAIRDPAAADMLEIAQTFHAKNDVAFRSSHRLQSGEVQLQYEENVQASAGRGNVEIPQKFTLGLAPFEGTDPYAVEARFRYRIVNGRLQLGYKLIRPDKVRRAAFTDVMTAVSEGVGLPVMAGTPRP